MRPFALLLTLSFLNTGLFAQQPNPEKKYSADQLIEDLHFLRKQIYQVHANPFSELSKEKYDRLFGEAEYSLRDSLTSVRFLQKIKPFFAYLSDEHANISIPVSQLSETYRTGNVFVPFSLSEHRGKVSINHILSIQQGIKPGDAILKINNIPIQSLINGAAACTTGYSDERHQKALNQFGYLYAWLGRVLQSSYTLTLSGNKKTVVQGVTLQAWQDELNRQAGWDNTCKETITYRKIGNAGYIRSCAFNVRGSQMDSIDRRINEIFKQIKQDKVDYLLIDVSQNGGGNSQVGTIIIDHFNTKPYREYQCNWKRSDEYLQLIKSWKMDDQFYENQPVGKVITFPPETHEPGKNDSTRYQGKVFIVVGNGTFSSAMMFATTIKDNKLATVIGQMPQNGHPTHFGELYNNMLPNTGLSFRFGVKEWIRPSGKKEDNFLHPDITLDLEKLNTPEALVSAVGGH